MPLLGHVGMIPHIHPTLMARPAHAYLTRRKTGVTVVADAASTILYT